MADDKTKKPITKEFLTSRLYAVQSGRTSPRFVAAELFDRLKNKVRDVKIDEKAKGGLMKKKKKTIKSKK